MPELKEVAGRVAKELTSPSNGYNRAGYQYAPQLVALGEELEKALSEPQTSISLRPDVMDFSRSMAAMMDLKDLEKGPVQEYSLQKAMMKIQEQWKKIEEYPMPQGRELERILIHIANFAMFAVMAIRKELK